MSETGVIQLTQHVAYPPAQVWAALTDPSLLSKWWASGNIRPEVGHSFTLDMGPFGEQRCRVLEVEHERKLSYTFGEGMLDTTITWTLAPEGEGTELGFTHAGFNLDTEMGQRAFGGMKGGWPGILAKIEPSLEAPVTHESCSEVEGPFYHGTRYSLPVGELLVAGRPSNFEEGRISNNIYFTAVLETAVWGAELATSLAGEEGRGHIYLVEPTGTFEDDPNVTNKRFPGNPTKSYRTKEPMRIVGEVEGWEAHPPEVLKAMLDNLDDLRRRGLAIIED